MYTPGKISAFAIKCDNCKTSITLPVPDNEDDRDNLNSSLTNLQCPMCHEDFSSTAVEAIKTIDRYNGALQDLGFLSLRDCSFSFDHS